MSGADVSTNLTVLPLLDTFTAVNDVVNLTIDFSNVTLIGGEKVNPSSSLTDRSPCHDKVIPCLDHYFLTIS